MTFQFIVKVDPKLEPIDDMLLLGVSQRKTLVEMGAEVGRSWAGVKKRLEVLELKGYIIYNPRKARGRLLTTTATEYLQANGLMKT